ncbi:hypothetical protein SUDANB121_03038 [Nocardiopsis dassonvillei]|uniref:hypothetical protein n=1 Tax=Nocardiopsis dassonvillei TaxID=2014 RepID=UPI003F549C45
MNRADATAARRAAAAAFGVVLALCVLLVVLLWSPVAAGPASTVPLGTALVIAAVVGTLGGGGFGWALSRRGWVPRPPAPAQSVVPVAAEDPVRKRARTSGWVAGIVTGVLISPFLFLAVALSFGALSVEAGSPGDAVLLAVLLSVLLAVPVGAGVRAALLRRPARTDPFGLADLSPPVRREAARAVARGRLTGDPPTDRAARDIALATAGNRVGLLSLAPLFWVLAVFLPQGLEHLGQEGPTFYAVFMLGLSAFFVLSVVGSLVLAVRQRNRARRFLVLFGEAEAPE